jgi:hypothetical protein
MDILRLIDRGRRSSTGTISAKHTSTHSTQSIGPINFSTQHSQHQHSQSTSAPALTGNQHSQHQHLRTLITLRTISTISTLSTLSTQHSTLSTHLSADVALDVSSTATDTWAASASSPAPQQDKPGANLKKSTTSQDQPGPAIVQAQAQVLTPLKQDLG